MSSSLSEKDSNTVLVARTRFQILRQSQANLTSAGELRPHCQVVVDLIFSCNTEFCRFVAIRPSHVGS